MRKTFTLVLLVLLSFTLMSCKGETNLDNAPNPVVTITVANYDEPIVLELYHNIAPNTVNNFIYYINEGYYDGLTFHRIIEDFMIQGGWGATQSCTIEGEFSSNGITNDLSHVRGVISMARTTVKNSATTQFFIVHQDSTFLDGNYAAFGMMTSGWDTLDAIAAVATDSNDAPLTDVVITSITVDTSGYTYPDPVCAN